MSASRRYLLTGLSCACALGRTTADVLANACAGSHAGMVSLANDIPNRSILFGMVPGDLPPVADPEFDMRACRLLLHAVGQFRQQLAEFIGRYGASRVAIVLGASNTGIDEDMTGLSMATTQASSLFVCARKPSKPMM